MLREDYLKLEEEYFSFLAAHGFDSDGRKVDDPMDRKNPTGFILSNRVSGPNSPRRRYPLVTLCTQEVVRVDGSILYTTPSSIRLMLYP